MEEMDRSPTRREEREDKSGNSSKPNGDNTMGAFFTLGGSSPEIPGISALLLPALPLHFLLVPPSRRRLEQDGRNAILLLPRGKTWNGTGRSGNSSKPNGDNTMGAFFYSSFLRFQVLLPVGPTTERLLCFHLPLVLLPPGPTALSFTSLRVSLSRSA